jgi:hypothetical protein
VRWVDCGAVVVRDTPENFDGVEKGFGFLKRWGELTQRAQRGGEEGAEK